MDGSGLAVQMGERGACKDARYDECLDHVPKAGRGLAPPPRFDVFKLQLAGDGWLVLDDVLLGLLLVLLDRYLRRGRCDNRSCTSYAR
jgi:hypothetical protein